MFLLFLPDYFRVFFGFSLSNGSGSGGGSMAGRLQRWLQEKFLSVFDVPDVSDIFARFERFLMFLGSSDDEET